MRPFLPLSLLTIGLLFSSCLKDDVNTYVSSYSEEERTVLQQVVRLPEHLHDYNVFLPEHLGGFQVHIDPHQAVLGRVLFYDRALSANGTVSCASCHRPELAFSDDEAFSIGALGERTSRNSLGLGAFPSFADQYNGATGARLFWDERAGTVFEQARQSLLNPEEMGHTSLEDVVAYVREQPHYQILLRKAFPSHGFLTDEQKLLEALQMFVHAIGSFDTKFDRARRKSSFPEKPFESFTNQENLGRTLFRNRVPIFPDPRQQRAGPAICRPRRRRRLRARRRNGGFQDPDAP
jgi:cytochrome c peroxidase